MTYFDERAQAREAATRLYSLLADVRRAPGDRRNYMLFDQREELNSLGVDDDQINAFDATDDAELDQSIARAGAVVRRFGRNEDDKASVHHTAQLGPSLRDRNPVSATAAGGPPLMDRRGGLYGDIGLGLGPGFNLHFDREGVTPSVGAGAFGSLRLGYATDIEALRNARQDNRMFGGVEVPGAAVGVEGRYRTTPGGLAPDGAEIAVGPLRIGVDGDGDVTGGLVFDRRPGSVSVGASPGNSYDLGFEGGFGGLKTLNTRQWGRGRK